MSGALKSAPSSPRAASQRGAAAGRVTTHAVMGLSGDEPGVNRGRWTEEEDVLLRQSVDRYGPKNWRVIAALFHARTDVQCLHREFAFTFLVHAQKSYVKSVQACPLVPLQVGKRC
jgi:hypothetical protein